jgi:hemerythrin-like domain-containing protein
MPVPLEVITPSTSRGNFGVDGRGTGMKATELLVHEHEVIGKVLDGAEAEAQRLRRTGEVRRERLGKMVDFWKNFVDRCHHTKEEKHLFPALEERGVPGESGPIAVMLQEHEEGRQAVRALAEALQAKTPGRAAQVLAERLEAYVGLLRPHIEKENNVLFPLADRVLSAGDQEKLLRAFEKVEAEEMGEGTHERYHQLAHELAEE